MTHSSHSVSSRLSILRRREVEARTGLSRSSIYLRIAAGDTFPSPIKLGGGRAVGWIEEEIETWLRQQIASTRNTAECQSARSERGKDGQVAPARKAGTPTSLQDVAARDPAFSNLLADGGSDKEA